MLCFPTNALCQHQAWKFESQRPELAPRYWTDSTLLFETQPTLVLAGNGKSYVNGMWTTSVPVQPESHHQFTMHYQSKKVEESGRCILAKIIWLDTSGKQIGRAEYPAIEKNDQLTQWTTITQLYQIPDEAKTAKIELIYRWDADGIVHFGGFSLKEAAELKSRNVRLATIQHQPKGSSGPDQNREEFADLIR